MPITTVSGSQAKARNASDERRAYYATQYRVLQSRTVVNESIRRLEEQHGIDDFSELDGEEATAEDWTEIVNLRPEDAPDWWIFSISGHCASCPNELNPEYLESNTSSTLDLIHTTMEDYGFTVESFAYSDEFYNRDSRLNTYHANAWLSGHDAAEPTQQPEALALPPPCPISISQTFKPDINP